MSYRTQAASWPTDDALQYDGPHPPHEQQREHLQQQQQQQYKAERHYVDPLGAPGFELDEQVSDPSFLNQYLVAEPFEDAGFGSFSTYPPHSASLSYGTPSPALPALSPPSTAGTSYESSPTGSAYDGLVSPHVLPSPHQHAPAQQHSFLLPAVDITSSADETSMQRDARRNQGSSSFADLQDSYLQQHAHASYVATPAPSTPTRTRTVSTGPSSATPRGSQVSSSHLYRSPSGYSPSSSPTKSPYARPPIGPSSPARGGAYLQRSASHRSPTKSDSMPMVNPESPSKRRQTRLSIDVPPYRHQSPRPRLQLPPRELPAPDAASGFHIVGDVELEATQEMEQLLGQLGSFIGPDATADSPQLQHRVPPTIPHNQYVQQSSAAQSRFEATHSTSAPFYSGGSIEISGVTLNPEDMDLLDEPELDYEHRHYPASAPAWQTTFNVGPSAPHPTYQHEQGSFAHYASAPLSPSYAAAQYSAAPLAPPLAFAPSHNDYHHPPLSAPSRPRSTPLNSPFLPHAPSPDTIGRRRRSSVDDAVSYALSQGYDSHPASYAYDHEQLRPPQSYPYSRPAPLHRHTYSPTPSQSSSVSATSPVAVHRLPPQPTTPRSPAKSASTSPGKTRTSPTKKKAGVPMFVNFGSADSKKLLSGVAPSGSSKRRREEQEAAAAAAAAAVAEGGTGSA